MIYLQIVESVILILRVCQVILSINNHATFDIELTKPLFVINNRSGRDKQSIVSKQAVVLLTDCL